MMKIRYYFLVVLLGLQSALIFAAPVVVQWVYRVSPIPPEIALVNGFVRRGDNYDFMAHAGGRAYLTNGTGFVSTTSDNSDVQVIRQSRRIQADYVPRPTRIWVYRIRANADTYAWLGTMEYLQAREAGDPTLAWLFRNMIESFGWQREYVNRGDILPNRISAYREWDPIQSVYNSQLVQNPGYVEANTSSSSEPYPVGNVSVDSALLALGFPVDEATQPEEAQSLGMVCTTHGAEAETGDCNPRMAVNVLPSNNDTCQKE